MEIISKFMKPYKMRIILMLFLLLIQALTMLMIPTFMSDIVDKGIVQSDMNYILKTSAVMLLTALVSAGISIAHIYLSSDNSALIARDIRKSVFRKTQEFAISDFNKFGTASMITRSTNDVMQIQTAFSTIIELLLPAPFMMTAGLILTFSKNRQLALVIICIMAVILFMALLLSKKAVPMFDRLLKLMDEMNQKVLEKISGVRVIRAFNRIDDERENLNNIFTGYGMTSIKINRLFAVLMPLITLIMNFCTLMIIFIGNFQINSGNMAIGDLYAIMEYATITLTYLIMGLSAIVVIPKLNISAKRIADVLQTENSIIDKADEKTENISEIEFKNVTFSYYESEKPVLSDINFIAKKGQTTAIIGTTGSGKSTILNLLMRFYEVNNGQILINGKNLKDISAEDFRSHIGYVPQKAFLFSGTIESNLCYGNPDADKKDMESAIKTAQLSDFVNELENGLQTKVSQGGTNFSGGQKQRLSIARAIIRKPSVYIFDDSFSALDYKTDAQLRNDLKHETENAIVIIVAQRISTIINAEQIIVIDEGKIVGKGNHDELMKNCAEYRQIAESQLNREEVK